MSDTAIRVDGLSKQYRIGGKQERYRTLRDTLTDAIVSPFRRARELLRGQAYGAAELGETIWALRDVSLEIKRGEVVGIIGPNGAGKTTLLKILSRITEPTEGQAEIHGRVGSLLEVGTGFHPELTGRENIYLNAAILGMKKSEIERKFDEIVAFAEIEKFIDTPVKHYSSGMYVRLAFAVAAHLEPEILLVDEVLAVGDLAFQKKCLGKMDEVSKEGRTVLFVSHNMGAVERLCTSAILLQSGTKIAQGATKSVIQQYLSHVEQNINVGLIKRKDRTGSGNVRFKEILFLGEKNSNVFGIGEDIGICITVENRSAESVNVRLSLSIRTAEEIPLISCDSSLLDQTFLLRALEEKEFVCRLHAPVINEGHYYINLAAYNKDGNAEDWIPGAAQFSVSGGQFADHIHKNNFPILTKFEWEIK